MKAIIDYIEKEATFLVELREGFKKELDNADNSISKAYWDASIQGINDQLKQLENVLKITVNENN